MRGLGISNRGNFCLWVGMEEEEGGGERVEEEAGEEGGERGNRDRQR